MNSIHSEFLKLKRSMSWAVVLVVPIIMVLAGSMSTMLAQGTFEDGWHTLWIRSVGFYGMAILPVAVAILASLVWRVEHKNSNWNALMSRPVPTSEVVLGKVAAIAALAASMQLVLLVTVIGLGKLVFGLEGMLPAKYLLGSPLIMLACVPLAALQSALSAFLCSFVTPVTIALVMTSASTLLLQLKLTAALALPYGLVTHTTQLGTSLVSGQRTSFAVPDLSLVSACIVTGAAVVLTALIVAITSMALNRTDTRA